MRSVLAVLMFATMIQVAQADDEDDQGTTVTTTCKLVTVNDVTQCI